MSTSQTQSSDSDMTRLANSGPEGEKTSVVEKAATVDDKKSPDAPDESIDADGVRFENGEYVVRLTGPDDPYSPLNLTTLRKWVIIGIISSATLAVTCGSSMVAFTYPAIEQEWQISRQVAVLGLTVFIFALGAGPLFLAPLSEFYGRQPIYLVSYFIFFLFNFGVAFAPNVWTWIICRFFDGLFGSAFLSVAGGTVADMFSPTTVAAPMGVYTMAPFLGPVMGPIISGFINQYTGWRWTWYMLIIWTAVMWFLIWAFVPETYLPALLVKKARKLRSEGRTDVKAPLELDERSIPVVVMYSCLRPFQIVALEPMALFMCIWSAVLLGEIYMFFSAFSIVYGAYGFDMSQTGLSFIGIGVGTIIGSCTQPIWGHYYKKASEKAGGGKPPPEEQLRRGMLGACVAPVALFWFAFTTYPSVHWMVSIVASGFFGFSVVLCFQASFGFLVDAYRPYAASAMAANSFMRSSSAAAFPLFTTQMFERLGTQWALALCAFLTLAIVPFPFLFYKFGSRLRRTSRFTPEGLERIAQEKKAAYEASQRAGTQP